MESNNAGRSTGRNSGNWRGRGRGGRGGWRNKQNWKSRDGNEDSNTYYYGGSANKSSSNNTNSHFNSEKRERRFSYSQFIPEGELGISEYICKNKKISGILKQMYSDFIVHEIDLDGKVVKLTSLDVPQENETANSSDCVKDSIIPSDKWQELTHLLEPLKDGCVDGAIQEVKIDVTELEKDSRGKTHLAIREVFGRKLQSNTQDIDGRKVIVVKKWKGSDSRDNWKRGKDKQYLCFTVYKQDMDTSETVNRISDKLRFKPSNLNFAGTKDRRACTSQKMSLWHGEPQRLKNLNIRNVWIGNYEFKGQTMKLGHLKGNMFTIALREMSNSDEEVLKNMTSLKEYGFINYFGTQRFGTNKNAPTHLVGKALLQSDFEKAVNLILHPRDYGCGIKAALDCWHKEKDAKKALALVKGSPAVVEVSLLRGLADAGKNDYLKALNCLPRNLRLLYLHAYQSFIWNRVVSRRIRQFGLKTLPGDLVLIDGSTSERTLDANVDVEEQLDLTSQNKRSEAEKNLSPNEQDDGVKVRVISMDEAETIPFDQIVLPTPGFKVTLPENEVKAWYSEMLTEDDLSMESLRQKIKEYSVGGSYRNVITKPTQLEWKILRYKNPQSPLLRTDVEELEGKPEPEDDPDGNFRALIVKFGLDSSTYATVALREIVDYVGAQQKKNEIADAEARSKINTDEESKIETPEVKLDLDPTGNESNADKAPGTVKMDIDATDNVSSQLSLDQKSSDVENNALLSSSQAVKRGPDNVEETPMKKAKVESNESMKCKEN